jgi:hypothetical protein
MDIFSKIIITIFLVIILLVVCFHMPSYSFFWGVIKLVSLFTIVYLIINVIEDNG